MQTNLHQVTNGLLRYKDVDLRLDDPRNLLCSSVSGLRFAVSGLESGQKANVLLLQPPVLVVTHYDIGEASYPGCRNSLDPGLPLFDPFRVGLPVVGRRCVRAGFLRTKRRLRNRLVRKFAVCSKQFAVLQT